MTAVGTALRIPTSETTWKSEQAFPGQAEYVSHARAFLVKVLAGYPMADDAVLVGSELSANAVMHSDSCKRGGRFIVRVEAHEGDYLWLEVEDEGGPWIERVPTDEHGRGLRVVAELASDWWIEGDELDRVVWARFDWPDA
jgi:anti-sigma regulatory factor (Ser/Thr protein kinase)